MAYSVLDDIVVLAGAYLAGAIDEREFRATFKELLDTIEIEVVEVPDAGEYARAFGFKCSLLSYELKGRLMELIVRELGVSNVEEVLTELYYALRLFLPSWEDLARIECLIRGCEKVYKLVSTDDSALTTSCYIHAGGAFEMDVVTAEKIIDDIRSYVEYTSGLASNYCYYMPTNDDCIRQWRASRS